MEEIEIEDVETQSVAGIQASGRYEEIEKILENLYESLKDNHVPVSGPPMYIFHEFALDEFMETNQIKNANVEVVVPVLDKIKDIKELRFYELPGGQMARTIHKGAYKEINSTYQKLFEWILENNYNILGPIRETYLNESKECEDEELVIIIYAPVEKY